MGLKNTIAMIIHMQRNNWEYVLCTRFNVPVSSLKTIKMIRDYLIIASFAFFLAYALVEMAI